MKVQFKKPLAVILAALFLLTAFPFAASAAVAAEQVVASSGTTGDCTWTLDDEGTLTISGNGAMGNYSSSTLPWGNSITSVVIEYGVTSVGSSVFSGCTGLESITIPNSVTSIGSYAFYGCTGLEGVYITDIAAWCNIKFDSYSSNPLYYAHNLYLNNQLVTDLEIPDSVTSIGDFAFEYCTGLTSVTIPDSVTSIGVDAFYDCTGLASVTIPDSVTSIGSSAFYGCTGLESVTIPDSVTSIGSSALSGCTGLTSVTIPDSVTIIGDSAFKNCTGLTSVTIPDSVTKYWRANVYGLHRSYRHYHSRQRYKYRIPCFFRLHRA